ncbi:MAG: glycosyltransferase family 9 protein [Mariniblastus sp.]
MTPTQPRILITRLSHIGDCILTLPLLTAIRRQFPNAFIAWAVESPTQQLLELHPDIDEIIKIPKGWMRKPKSYRELRRTFKSHQFDIAIDPQGITKSAALAWLSGAKQRIGIKGRWGRELSPYLNNDLVETQSEHIVDRSLELLKKMPRPITAAETVGLGSSEGSINSNPNRLARNEFEASDFDSTNLAFGLPVCKTSLATTQSWLKTNVWDPNQSKQFVLINPGGSWASKRWEMERYGSVASYLKTHHELTSVVVWAGEEEQQMAQQIHAFDPSAAVIAMKTNLRELAAVASQASFFIGGDTGPLHIASAFGTPCIGLYGTTRPEESGAYGDNHIAIQKWYQSGSCRKRRSADNDAMRDIMAADVFSACDKMLQSLQRKNSAA